MSHPHERDCSDSSDDAEAAGGGVYPRDWSSPKPPPVPSMARVGSNRRGGPVTDPHIPSIRIRRHRDAAQRAPHRPPTEVTEQPADTPEPAVAALAPAVPDVDIRTLAPEEQRSHLVEYPHTLGHVTRVLREDGVVYLLAQHAPTGVEVSATRGLGRPSCV